MSVQNRSACSSHYCRMKAGNEHTNNGRGSIARRAIDLAGWIVPGVIVALIPKCPACLGAYIAFWTGLGLSVAAAANMRVLLILVGMISLGFLAARQTRRLMARPHASP